MYVLGIIRVVYRQNANVFLKHYFYENCSNLHVYVYMAN